MKATHLTRKLRAAGVNINPRGNLFKREGSYIRDIGDKISITVDVDDAETRSDHLTKIANALDELGIPYEKKTGNRGFWIDSNTPSETAKGCGRREGLGDHHRRVRCCGIEGSQRT